jgi:hypothetical protein
MIVSIFDKESRYQSFTYPFLGTQDDKVEVVNPLNNICTRQLVPFVNPLQASICWVVVCISVCIYF